jgi:hypothetical protein
VVLHEAIGCVARMVPGNREGVNSPRHSACLASHRGLADALCQKSPRRRVPSCFFPSIPLLPSLRFKGSSKPASSVPLVCTRLSLLRSLRCSPIARCSILTGLGRGQTVNLSFQDFSSRPRDELTKAISRTAHGDERRTRAERRRLMARPHVRPGPASNVAANPRGRSQYTGATKDFQCMQPDAQANHQGPRGAGQDTASFRSPSERASCVGGGATVNNTSSVDATRFWDQSTARFSCESQCVRNTECGIPIIDDPDTSKSRTSDQDTASYTPESNGAGTVGAGVSKAPSTSAIRESGVLQVPLTAQDMMSIIQDASSHQQTVFVIFPPAASTPAPGMSRHPGSE